MLEQVLTLRITTPTLFYRQIPVHEMRCHPERITLAAEYYGEISERITVRSGELDAMCSLLITGDITPVAAARKQARRSCQQWYAGKRRQQCATRHIKH